MDDNIQSKLERLEELEQQNKIRRQANRVSSKRYLDSLKAQGKRQLSIILDDTIIDELTRLKDGRVMTWGEIITSLVNKNSNIDSNISLIDNLKNVNDSINIDVVDDVKDAMQDDVRQIIKNDIRQIIKNDVKQIVNKDVTIDKTDDVKDFSHSNAGMNQELYNMELNKILKKIVLPGKWAAEAKKLNELNIKTPKGKEWTSNNLRALYNSRFKQ